MDRHIAGMEALISRKRGLWSALLLVLCVAAFLPGFFSIPPVDRDEPRFAQASKQMLETGDFVDIRLQGESRYAKPIGIYWFQAASAALFGNKDQNAIWAYRLPSLFGAILAVAFTAWVGTRLFSRQVGLIAAATLATCVLLGVEARLAKTDAMLLASIVGAQAVLARLYTASADEALPRRLVVAFWAAFGLGVLIKGPIILLVAGATCAALIAVDRNARWLRPLLDPWGVVLFLCIVLPWFGAILIKTDGGFFTQSVGKDLLAKATGGRESHGAPPGYFLLTFFLTFWPWSLLSGIAAFWAWSNRALPAVKFCAAWIVPAWLVFELVPTKLPHYILPLFPALSILLSATLVDLLRSGNSNRPNRFAMWGPMPLWLLVTLFLCAGAVALPVVMGPGIDVPGVFGAGVVALASGIAAASLYTRRYSCVIVALLAAGLAAAVTVYGRTLPGLDSVWISSRLQKAVVSAADATCPKMAVAIAGYREPSAVFLLGTHTLLTDGIGAAEFLAEGPCRLAAVERRYAPRFLEGLSKTGRAVRTVSTISGIKLNGGQKLEISLYKATPRGN